LVFRFNNIPYTLQDKLKALGAAYHKATIPFNSHVEQDGLLITGQNPLSAGPTAQALIEMLDKK
jgi:putative intracellular protease/amidase